MRLIVFTLLAGLLFSLTGCVTTETEKKADPSEMAKSHYTMGLAYLEESSPSQAIKELLKAQEYDADNADVTAAMAKAYEMKKVYPLAEEYYRKAIEQNPSDPYNHHNLGAMYLQLERYSEAIPEFKTAAENLLFPRTDMALAGIGYAYQQQENYAEAAEYYTKALEQNPSYAETWLRLGESTFALGQSQQALAHYQKAVGLAPEFPLAYYRMGLAYLDLNRIPEARKAFQTTIEQAPESAAAGQARHYLLLLE